MREHGLEVPENEYEALGGVGFTLIFGNFVFYRDQPSHMFVDLDTNVAVFPQKNTVPPFPEKETS